MTFLIRVSLTKKGLQNYKEVILRILKYILKLYKIKQLIRDIWKKRKKYIKWNLIIEKN